MRVRLINIALNHDGKPFDEGAILVAGEDIPAELVEQLLKTDRAQLVLDDEETSAELAPAIDAFRQAFALMATSVEALVSVAERAGAGAPRAVMEAMEEVIRSSPSLSAVQDRLAQLEAAWKCEAEDGLAAQVADPGAPDPGATSNDNPSEQTGGPASAGDSDAVAGDQSQAGSAQAAADQAPAADAGATLSEGGSDVSTSAEAAGTGETGTATQASSGVSSDEAGAAGAGVEPPSAVGATPEPEAGELKAKPRKIGK